LISWGAFARQAEAATTIGVASFERVAGEGQGVPDVAGRLAQRLGTKGVDKVVGPAELGAPAVAEPTAADAAGWASEAAVGYLVVGRTTRMGSHLSVDLRLLEGATGLPVGPRLVEEASRPEDLGRAVDVLASALLERIAETSGEPASRPVAATGSAGVEQSPGTGKKRPFSEDTPISIKSDELEATEKGGRRKFVFTGNVRAEQADLIVDSDRLEAFYPQGGSQPDRLVATGHVVLVQAGKTARCEKAVYYRVEDKLVCTGNYAELDQECDTVRGETITFFLDTEVLKVNGAADVRLRPDVPGCATNTASSTAP
jgi:lipopolysaccharide export system protein LptA